MSHERQLAELIKMLYLILILKWTQSDMNLALLFHLRRGQARIFLFIRGKWNGNSL